MSAAKHTPGLWRLVPGNGRFAVVRTYPATEHHASRNEWLSGNGTGRLTRVTFASEKNARAAIAKATGSAA